MANLKRRVERIHRVNIKRPSVRCFCNEEGLVVTLYYDKEIFRRRLLGSFVSGDDLWQMERDIATAFEELAWHDMTGLMNITEWMLEENLFPVIEVV